MVLIGAVLSVWANAPESVNAGSDANVVSSNGGSVSAPVAAGGL